MKKGLFCGASILLFTFFLQTLAFAGDGVQTGEKNYSGYIIGAIVSAVVLIALFVLQVTKPKKT